MNSANKYDVINGVKVQVNDLVDLKGIDKCVASIEAIQKLNQLEQLLKNEDATNEKIIKDLTTKLDSTGCKGEDESCEN